MACGTNWSGYDAWKTTPPEAEPGECVHCHRVIDWDYTDAEKTDLVNPSGYGTECVCEECAEKYVACSCGEDCGDVVHLDDFEPKGWRFAIVNGEKRLYCGECWSLHRRCHVCGRWEWIEEMNRLDLEMPRLWENDPNTVYICDCCSNEQRIRR